MGAPETDVVVDAGWLGHTGVGRVTARFLAGAAAIAPSGWAVWCPPSARLSAWDGLRHVPTRHPPMQFGAQRDILGAPTGRVMLSLHAVRPLALWRTSVVYLHDTIPLRWDTPARRRWWRAFFRLSVRGARAVVVNSAATADRAIADLAVAPERIAIATPPPDRGFVRSVAAARSPASEPFLLYVGQIKPHKNLERAIGGFERSRFAAHGGRFVIIGGAYPPRAGVARPSVEWRRSVQDDELVEWYAGASAVILPSLEEGYGLPVAEALCAGIPVCCSDIEPLRGTAGGRAALFDPLDVASIADAIDSAVCSAAPNAPEYPTDRAFAEAVVGALE